MNFSDLETSEMLRLLSDKTLDIVFSKKVDNLNYSNLKFIKLGYLNDIFLVNKDSDLSNKVLDIKVLKLEGGIIMNREEAIKLLKKYNSEEFHLRHALTVEQVMRYFAKQNGESQDFWGLVGLLHDVDYEKYPNEHCKKAPELLKEINASDEMVHAICSHAYGICSDVKPEHEMEKILFAVDELTGLVWAAAKMRPSHSTKDMEVSSLKKKFKDKKFAAGCSRDTIRQGAEQLGWDLDYLFESTILAMRDSEDKIEEEMMNFV